VRKIWLKKLPKTQQLWRQHLKPTNAKKLSHRTGSIL
jgi:hypothetical protein